ncbi:MAG: SH3 domain-containing protein, partial [Gemmatimonadaceae bacterium]
MISLPSFVRRVAAVAAVLVSACVGGAPRSAPATAPAPSRPAPAAPAPVAPAPSAAPALPPIPAVHGALAIDVVYPAEGHLMTARDSTFLFGSVGNGDASLTINGAPVTVLANGSFMAYLPVPSDTAYSLLATLPSGERAELVRRIRFPARPTGPRPPVAQIDTAGFPRIATLANTNADATSDTDMVTVVRPTPGGTYKWFLFPGTEVQATGELSGFVRIRLDNQLEAWVERGGVRFAGDTGLRRRTI